MKQGSNKTSDVPGPGPAIKTTHKEGSYVRFGKTPGVH